jgi:hypothetical protein
MNKELMEHIIDHVFANLAIIPSSFIDFKRTKSLISTEYLLPEKITLDLEGEYIQNRVWGCQISIEKQEMRMLLADCSQDKETPEYALLVQLKDSPAYGLYIVCNTDVENAPMIAVSLNGNEWMECQTYLQATFLAAMEQVKEVGLAWNKCTNYQDNFKSLLSFIEFHTIVYEAKYEGQEDGSSFSK